MFVEEYFVMPEDGAVEVDVLPRSEVWVEACADFDEGRDAAPDFDAAARRVQDARDDFEQGGFPGAVEADEAEDVAFLDVEADVIEGGKFVVEEFPLQEPYDVFFECVDFLFHEVEFHGDVTHFDDWFSHAMLLSQTYRMK